MKKKLNSHKKLIIAVISLIVSSIVGLALLIAVTNFGEDEYEINNLQVKQNKFSLDVSWDPVEDANGYSLLVYSGFGIPQSIKTDDTEITIDDITIDKRYRIVVSALEADGSSNGAAEKRIKTKKLKQKISVSDDEFEGFAGDGFTLTGTGKGKIEYVSGNSEIAEVTEDGQVTLQKAGTTTINVRADETKIYRAATVKVDIKVCPDTLDAPNIKIETEKSTEVSLSWTNNEYATEYQLFRMNPATDKYEKIKTVDKDTHQISIHRTQGKYGVKAVAVIREKTVSSDLSSPVNVKPAASEAQTYTKAHNLKEISKSDLHTIALIHGTGSTKVPQSMSYNGSEYIISYVNHGGTVGKFVVYDEKGKKVREKSEPGMGHANGATLNRNTGIIYVAKTHKKKYTAASYAYKESNLSPQGAFKLPRVTSGIAYDPTNDKYYLSKGNVVYVADSNFKVERSLHKKARYNHAQDVGGYNGVVYVCTWVNGKTSYIDMYRTEDGAYLGSYYIPLGEIESCLVDDDGYLIILMNIKGTNDAYIYKTKERVSF
ncbi:MAG: hypothetical protein Q4C80_06210 [Bacillota bacterium]|nr:hypothetical protein [Bacillota bacterium]